MSYEEECQEALRLQEDFVRSLRFEAAASGAEEQYRELNGAEKLLKELRAHVLHTITDPDVAARILNGTF